MKASEVEVGMKVLAGSGYGRRPAIVAEVRDGGKTVGVRFTDVPEGVNVAETHASGLYAKTFRCSAVAPAPENAETQNVTDYVRMREAIRHSEGVAEARAKIIAEARRKARKV